MSSSESSPWLEIMTDPVPAPEVVAPATQSPAAPKKQVKRQGKTEKRSEIDQSEDRDKIIQEISLFLAEFPHETKGLSSKGLEKMSMSELEELSRQIDVRCSAGIAVGATAQMAGPMFKVFEDLMTKYTPLKIGGAHEVFNRPDVIKMVKYEIIKSGYGINATNRQRLLFAIIQACAQAHATNVWIESLKPEAAREIAEAMRPRSQGDAPQSSTSADNVASNPILAAPRI